MVGEKGEWKVENGKWRMESGEWKVGNGKWGMGGNPESAYLCLFQKTTPI